jgi:hypothetical protein
MQIKFRIRRLPIYPEKLVVITEFNRRKLLCSHEDFSLSAKIFVTWMCYNIEGRIVSIPVASIESIIVGFFRYTNNEIYYEEINSWQLLIG